MQDIYLLQLSNTDVRDVIISYLPLDVSSEELTLGNVHSVPCHSQPQLLSTGDRISGKALLVSCDTQCTQTLLTSGGWWFLK